MFRISMLKCVFLTLIFSVLFLTVSGQGSLTEFGKNRVQYHEFVWSFYETDNFVTYYYLGGQQIGKFVVQLAEQELTDIEEKLEYKLGTRIDILVYNNLSDFNQSNIGVGVELANIGGLTKIVGNKMFVYFDGNHQHLRKQIREGIAQVYVNDMMYGGNLQEVLQNAVLLSLPTWYSEGIVSYIGENWSTELDNKLRDGILSGRYEKFNKLGAKESRYAGHFIWHYITQTYGAMAVPNLLYLTRINRSIESGFLFVLGKSVKQTVKDWYDYNLKLYNTEQHNRVMPDEELIVHKKNKKKSNYSNFKLNNDGVHFAYVDNEIGRYKVRLQNMETGKKKVILRGGFKTVTLPVDYERPLLAWSPSGVELGIIREKRDKIFLITYNLETKKKEKHQIMKFQDILDFTYKDEKNLLMSAVNRGQSDIYTYNLPTTRVNQITNDFYDDLQPRWVNVKDPNRGPNWEGIIWLSNRVNDTMRVLKFDTVLPVTNFDAWFYDNNKGGVIVNVSQTPSVNEFMPGQYNQDHVSYLSESNGIVNRHVAYFKTIFSHYDTTVFYRSAFRPGVDSIRTRPNLSLDSLKNNRAITIVDVKRSKVYKDIAVNFPQTNYDRNILEQEIVTELNVSAELILHKGLKQFYKIPVQKTLRSISAPELLNTDFRKQNLKTAALKDSVQNAKVLKVDSVSVDSGEVDIESYYFESEFKSESVFGGVRTTEAQEERTSSLRITASRIRPYRVKLSTDYVVSQLDNSLIFTGYQPFSGRGGSFSNPDLNAMINVSISDLMEDHRFVGGFRLPTSFKGAEYFITYENLKKRLDKKIIYYRKNDIFQQPTIFLPIFFKFKTNYWQTSLKWPLDIPRSFRGHFGFRNERTIVLSTDSNSLEFPIEEENWISGRFEYVFDNTITLSMNIMHGSRYKLYVEQHKQLNTPQSHFTVMGVDFRHYEKIHRQLIWANRFAASTSFGPRKLVYYLGGVDNWFFPKFNNEFPPSPDAGYAFQALATNLRGFDQNIRNGNSYAVINSEIRWPIFAYFIKTPIRSAIIKNFQVIAFGDVGTAWEGISPYKKNNPLNTKVFNDTYVVVVNYFRDPLVAGYGTGIRTIVFGYFIRIDVAWGVEDRAIQKAKWYFSLSLDF